MFTKKYKKVGEDWKSMILTEEETREVLIEHHKHCIKVLKESLYDAEHEFKQTLGSRVFIRLATALFNKRAIAPFSFISSALESKIQIELSK